MAGLAKKIIVFLIVLMSFTLFLDAVPVFADNLIPTNDEFSIPLDKGWEYKWENDDYKGSLALPCKVGGRDPGSVLWISNKLPAQNFDSPVLFLRTSQQFMKVYMGTKLIYSYEGKSGALSLPGSSWHFIKLPQEYMGSKIEISLVSPFSQYSGNINSIYLGSESSMVLKIVFQYGGILIISCIILLFGIILLVLLFALRTENGKFTGHFYLGLFSLLSGIWVASESKIIQLIINEPVLLFYTACISLYLMPIPFLLFIRSTFNIKKQNWLNGFTYLFAAFFIFVSILQIINKMTYINVLPLFHALVLVCILAIMYISAIEIWNGNKGIKLFFLGCMVLCVFTVVDMSGFYISDIPGLNSQGYMQFAILVFILLMSAGLGQNILEIQNEKARGEIYKSLAYTDILTGLKNRNSLEEVTLKVNQSLKTKKAFVVVIFDINNLKEVNDSFGHLEGDKLIYRASRIIDECFGKMGDIYRIGGDEFALIAEKVTEPEILERLDDFEKKINNSNNTEDSAIISIAYGMAWYREKEDKELKSIFSRADMEMYKNKQKQKSSSNLAAVVTENT